jgi:hypothetical protein
VAHTTVTNGRLLPVVAAETPAPSGLYDVGFRQVRMPLILTSGSRSKASGLYLGGNQDGFVLRAAEQHSFRQLLRVPSPAEISWKPGKRHPVTADYSADDVATSEQSMPQARGDRGGTPALAALPSCAQRLFA